MLIARFRIGGLLAAMAMAINPVPVYSQTSQWVERGATGRLIYTPDAEGDRILDFSNVGYKGQGAAAIPNNISNFITLSAIGGDDTTQIQNAINMLAAQPISPDGYRGAILLQAGTYDIDSQLLINASGIVLRGEGQGAGGTILKGRNAGAVGTNQRPLIRIEGTGSQSLLGSTLNTIDKTVPVGANSFRLNNTSSLAVGDAIRIERPSNQAWIEAVGMDQPLNGDPAWVAGSMNIRYDRVITRIEGDRVFIDSPLANSFELQYGGMNVKRYSWPGVTENVGIENLRGDTDFDNATDEDHAWEFISIGGTSQSSNRAQDVWVRDITAVHFGDSAVVANPSSKWVTVEDATSIAPISIITGSRRYTYDLSGSHGFVTGSSADEGRHDFVTNSSRPAGPNVFHDSIATNANSDTGPHQRWSSGTLYDQITVDGNAINARNRETAGTRHGWSGANIVVWNSSADSFKIQNPPTAQNWLIGSSGTIIEDMDFGPQPSGNYDSHGTPIADIPSLYDAQAQDDADVDTYNWSGGDGNWADVQGWAERATPLSRSVEQRDYLIGDIDGFVNDGAASVDNAYIDPAFEAEVLGSSALPITGFDDLAGNQNVTFTQQYVLDPGDVVVHGWLALGLRQGGGGLVNTDFVKIDGAGQMGFAVTGWDTQINTTDTFVGVIDLGTTSLLPILNDDSQLSVQVNDDTGVDWAMLSVTVLVDKGAGAADAFIESGGTITVDSAVAPVRSLTISNSTLRVDHGANLDVLVDLDASASGSSLVFGLDAGGASLIDVNGDADIDGTTIDLDLLGDFTPTASQSFDLLTALTITGTPAIEASDMSFWSLAIVVGGNGQNLRATYLGALAGDLNTDGFVGIADLNIVLGAWNQSVPPGNPLADPTGDGFVGIADLNVVLGHWNEGTPPLDTINIPEPTMLGVLTVATLGLLGRRRNISGWDLHPAAWTLDRFGRVTRTGPLPVLVWRGE